MHEVPVTADPTVASLVRFSVNLGLAFALVTTAAVARELFFAWLGEAWALSSAFSWIRFEPALALVIGFAVLATTASHFAGEDPSDLTRSYYLNGAGALAALVVFGLVVRIGTMGSGGLDFFLLFGVLVVPTALCYSVVMTHLGGLFLKFTRFRPRSVRVASYALFVPTILLLAMLYCGEYECFP